MVKMLTKKKKGFIVTFELIFCVVTWALLMIYGMYIVKAQITQKYMYNSFVQVAMATSKWGGTNTNLYAVNGRSYDLATNMQTQIRQLTGQNVTISVSPAKVTKDNKKIEVSMTWTDFGIDSPLLGAFVSSKKHSLHIKLDSVVQPGKLL